MSRGRHPLPPGPIPLRLYRGRWSLAAATTRLSKVLEVTPDGQVCWPCELTEAGMKERDEDIKQIGLRLPSSLVDRLEAAAERATRLTGGLSVVTRSDVARVLLARVLGAFEAELEDDERRGDG